MHVLFGRVISGKFGDGLGGWGDVGPGALAVETVFGEGFLELSAIDMGD